MLGCPMLLQGFISVVEYETRVLVAAASSSTAVSTSEAFYFEYVESNDEFYDRRSTFPPKLFLNDGVPQPKNVGMSILFRKMICVCTWVMEFVIGCDLIFAQVIHG